MEKISFTSFLKQVCIIIGIFAVLFLSAIVCSCNAQTTTTSSIASMEQYEHNPEVSVNDIYFEFEHIIDFIYNPIDSTYWIEYDDQDVFDYDNLAYLSNEEHWYGDFITAKVSSDVFFSIIADYNADSEERFQMEINEKYILKEIVTPVEGGGNYTYEITKNPAFMD